MSVDYVLCFNDIYFPTTTPSETLLDIRNNDYIVDSVTITGSMTKENHKKVLHRKRKILDYLSNQVKDTSYSYCRMLIDVIDPGDCSGSYSCINITFSKYKMYGCNN